MRRSISLAAVVALMGGLLSGLAAAPASAHTWRVSRGESIQQAINQAQPGDVIRVGPGVYRENLTITKNGITLVGSGATNHATVLKPGAQRTPTKCVDPEAPNTTNGICVLGGFTPSGQPTTPVTNVEIRGFRVQGFSGFGVLLLNAHNVSVTDSVARNNGGYGISGFVLSGVTMGHNVAAHNGEPGFYIGDSPHANARVFDNIAYRNGVGGPEGLGFLFRDASHGKVWNNRAWGNCVGFVFVDTAEDPVPTTDWTAVRNVAKRNNGACTGETNGPPPLSGIGILALGTQQTTIAHNRVLNNRPTGKSVASGGIVLASAKAIGGAVPTGNLIARNTARHNQPFDIVWDLSGTNNRFVHNHCGTSRPAWICG